MSDNVPRLQQKYDSFVRPGLVEQFGYKNPLTIPRLEKITINMGVGSATQDKKHLETAVQAMTGLAGQQPVVTKARKSIAGFRLRQGMPIGCMVTLRRQRMYEFLDRMVSVVLPRVRDFRGINRKAFDGNGNYSMGLSEILVFPELNPDKFTRPQGLNITIATSANTNEEALQLLTLFGMPFREAPQKSTGAA